MLRWDGHPQSTQTHQGRREEVGAAEVDHGAASTGDARDGESGHERDDSRSRESCLNGHTEVPKICPATWVLVTSARLKRRSR